MTIFDIQETEEPEEDKEELRLCDPDGIIKKARQVAKSGGFEGFNELTDRELLIFLLELINIFEEKKIQDSNTPSNWAKKREEIYNW